MHRTNSDSLKSCLCFRVFRLSFASDFFNLLLVRFHQAEITIVKHLIQGRNKKAWVGVEPSTLRSCLSLKDAPNHSATVTLPTEQAGKFVCCAVEKGT